MMTMKLEKEFVEALVDVLDEYLADPSVVERVLYDPKERTDTFRRLAELRVILDDHPEFSAREALPLIAALYYTIAVNLRSFMASEHRRAKDREYMQIGLIMEWGEIAFHCENWHEYEENSSGRERTGQTVIEHSGDAETLETS